jgi:hypothetical protein
MTSNLHTKYDLEKLFRKIHHLMAMSGIQKAIGEQELSGRLLISDLSEDQKGTDYFHDHTRRVSVAFRRNVSTLDILSGTEADFELTIKDLGIDHRQLKPPKPLSR